MWRVYSTTDHSRDGKDYRGRGYGSWRWEVKIRMGHTKSRLW